MSLIATLFRSTVGCAKTWKFVTVLGLIAGFIHFILCWVFGLSIGFINPFLFKIYNVGFNGKRFTIKLKSAQLVFSFTSWSKVLIVFEGFELILHDVDIPLKESGTTRKSSNDQEPAQKPKNKEKLANIANLKPLSIFGKNSFANKLIKFYLLYFRFVGIQLHNLVLDYEALGLKFDADSFLAKVSLKSFDGKVQFKFATKLLQQRVNGIETFDNLLLDVLGDLHMSSGSISKIKVDSELRNLSLPVITVLRDLNRLKEKSKRPEKPEFKDEAFYFERLYRRIFFMSYFVNLVEELSFSFHGLSLNEIPLANKYIGHCSQYKPLVLFELNVNSYVAKIKRMHFDSPGYGLSYLFGDKPYSMVNNFTGLSLLMKNTHTNVTKEIINIPVMNLTGSSNHAFQTVEAARLNLSGLSAAKGICMAHISEPVVDLSTEDIATAVMSALQYTKHQHIVKTQHPELFVSSKESFEESAGWKHLNEYSNLLPTLEVKLGIENSVFMIKSVFEDEFYRMILLKFSSVKMEFNSYREAKDGRAQYFTTQRVDVNSLKLQYRNNKTGHEINIINSDNTVLRQRLDILPSPLLVTDIVYSKTDVELSDIVSLHGINKVFMELKLKIVPLITAFKKHAIEFDCFCSHIHDEKHQFDIESDIFDDSKPILQAIDTLIPNWAKSIKFDAHELNIILGSRSLMISKELLKLVPPQSKNDLINGQLRRVEISVEQFTISASVSSQGDSSGSTTAQSSLDDDDGGLSDTSSTLFTEYVHWVASIETNRVIAKVISEKSTKKDVLKDKILFKLPNSTITVSPCRQGNDRVVLSWEMPKVDVFYSVISHFIAFSTIHLIRNTVFEFLLQTDDNGSEKDASPEIDEEKTPPVGQRRSSIANSPNFKRKLLQSLEFNLNIDFLNLILIMPDELKLKLELTNMSVMAFGTEPILVNSHYTRLCAESPTSPGYWTRIITAIDGSTSINLATILEKGQEDWLNLSNDTCHISIPDGFIIYKVFNNIAAMYKTLKQLHHSLKYNTNEFIINPHVEDAKKVPNINLKSNRLMFSYDDDPFESELNMILQIGLMEQRMRLEKLKLLDEKVQEDFQNSRNPVEKSQTFREKEFGHGPSKLKNLIKTNHEKKANIPNKEKHDSNYASSLPVFSSYASPSTDQKEYTFLQVKDEALKRVERLREHFSQSWIERVKSYRKNAQQEFQTNFKFLWGNLDTRQLPKDFDKRVLDFINSPTLFNLILEGFDFNIGRPTFGLENLPLFINDVGKGVPTDTEYSTLIPIKVDLRLTELRCHLRDYPLPLIHMPAVTKEQASRLPAVHVHGDIVIGEAMVVSEKEIRTVFVPLVPGCTEDDQDPCYSIEVPRTITAIKMFTKLDWELNSKESTKVTWGTSYQPCIQQIMLNLDNFTKPPIDPSEKVGFWDKIREMFHARMNFHWNHGGQFQILFKGSKDPYSICGLNSGFVLSYKDNITLKINENDNPSEFMVVNADKISFDVPNNIASPLLVWSRKTSDAVLLVDPNSNFHRSAFGYYLGNFTETDPIAAAAMKRIVVEKPVITLTGGVQMKLGVSFERKAENGERTSHSKHHYDVLLSNPKYIDDLENYDAFRGFRSDFIHMGLTLISKSQEAYNTIQLTPTVFKNFFAWWHMFSNTLSIRHGKVFGPEKASKKFGSHLYTFKYQAILEPLFISHVYQDLEAADHHFSNLEACGVKGRTSKLVLDLHQRKELTVDHNSNLNVTRKTMRMKFNVGKVDLEDLDLRTLRGDFISVSKDEENGQAERKFESFDSDISWFDLADFAEIGVPFLGRYHSDVKAHPMLHTPKFIYNKHNGYGDKHQVDFETGDPIRPFGDEEFHQCELKSRPLAEIRQECLNQRLNELTSKLNHNLELISRVPKSTAEERNHVGQLKVDNEQMRHGIKLVERLIESYNHGTNENPHDKSSFDFDLNEDESGSGFTNGFTLHNVLLKWNEFNRDIIYRYIYLFELNGKYHKFLMHKALAQLDDAIESQRRSNLEGDLETRLTLASTYDSTENSAKEQESLAETRVSEKLKNFKEELRQAFVSFFYKTHDTYQLRFISPQIQLQSHDDRKSCVLVVAPNIELNVIAFDSNETDEDYNENIFEQRFGSVLKDASIFMFRENEVIDTGKLFFSPMSYGSTTSWPPWLGIELCYDSSLLSDHVLMSKTSVIVRYDKMNNSTFVGSDADNINRLSCDLSQAAFTCDAQQYYTLYNIGMHLLIYNDPRVAVGKERISKMILRLDVSDLAAVRKQIVRLQDAIRQANYIISNMVSRRPVLDEFAKDDLVQVASARHDAYNDLDVLMYVSMNAETKVSTESVDVQQWNIRADDIKLHMLDESRRPFLDVILFDSHFTRVERSDRSDKNVISIRNLEVINLDKDSHLPVVFSSYKVEKKPKKKIIRDSDELPLIQILWHMDAPVGGIRVMRKFDINLQPVQISLEENTGTKIQKYAFPDQHSSLEDEDASQDPDNATQNSGKSSTLANGGTNGISASHSVNSSHLQLTGATASDCESTKSSFLKIRSITTESEGVTNLGSILSREREQDQANDRSASEMMDRASNYLSFISFKMKSAVICVTFRGNGTRKLINVSNFILKLPEIAFTNRTYTLLDLTIHIKKAVLKALLSHTGSILGNKLTRGSGKRVQKPLKGISGYASSRIKTFRE